MTLLILYHILNGRRQSFCPTALDLIYHEYHFSAIFVSGPFFRNRFYPNHGKQEVEFAVPGPVNGETLVNAEVRLMTNQIRALNVTFHLFQKSKSWVYLDSKTVPQDGADWISLTVISNKKEFNVPPGKMSFLVLSAFRNFEKGFRLLQFLQPVLLLYYRSQFFSNGSISNPWEMKRRKRHLQEDYEEETNRIWDSDGKRRRSRNTCRRKPLYIEFSEINYDKWIVAPTGYEVNKFMRLTCRSRKILDFACHKK